MILRMQGCKVGGRGVQGGMQEEVEEIKKRKRKMTKRKEKEKKKKGEGTSTQEKEIKMLNKWK